MAAVLISGLPCGMAHAQATNATSITFEAETDRRERGLSWSDGKVALGASAYVPITYNLAVDIDAVTLRDSARHGGAGVGLTVAPHYTLSTSGWDFTAGARGNAFIGRSGISFVELTGDVARTLGPAQLIVGAAFAPSQKAIGGNNLYIDAQLSASVPGTPFTLYGGVGHTSGSTRNDSALLGQRDARLRPGGDYLDHHLGAEYTNANLALGLRYSGTSIGRDEIDMTSRYIDRHYGSRVVAYLRFTP